MAKRVENALGVIGYTTLSRYSGLNGELGKGLFHFALELLGDRKANVMDLRL